VVILAEVDAGDADHLVRRAASRSTEDVIVLATPPIARALRRRTGAPEDDRRERATQRSSGR
jgi:hypothetical protein